MNHRRILLIAAILFLGVCLPAVRAAAQPSPTNMRSGSSSGQGPSSLTSLYTVPSGNAFVLTDFTFTTYPFLSNGSGSLITLRNISDVRWAWWAFDNSVASGGHENPVGGHWTTGLVFNSGETIALGVGNQAMPATTTWIASWSGYLVPNGVSDAGETLDSKTGLGLSASPNPAHSTAEVEFRLSSENDVVVAIFDVEGHRIRTLVDGHLPTGNYSVPWDGTDQQGRPVGDGVYFAQVETPESQEVKKLVRMR
jgi:hypothetical protein